MSLNGQRKMIEQVVNNLEIAYRHVYRRKCKTNESNDLWHLAHDWGHQRKKISDMLRRESYHFSPVRSYEYKDNKYLYTFRTVDALVIKAIALTLIEVLPRSPLCHSYKGHGGVKRALARVQACEGTYLLKTDVQDYYASIDHFLLLEKLSVYISPDLLRLIYKALKCLNMHLVSIEKGLPRGSAMSHVLGNFYLHELDMIFAHRWTTQSYIRYMDDILVMTTAKGALRRADRTIKQTLNKLKLNYSYQKSYIGKVSKEKELLFLGKKITI